jgi:VWFA-related protein
MQRLLLAGLLCIATGLTVPGQEPLTVFRAESNLVVLHVNVFDGRSDAVADLPQDAFKVFEDGTPQEITFFSGADVPVTAGLILDASGSMIAREHMIIAGGSAFAQSSHPEDELFTIHFNEQVKYGLPQTVNFTSSRSLLHLALSAYRPGGRTALYDAVIAGLEHFDAAMHQKHVLVVLSDGEDNASIHTRDEMMARVRDSDAIIYTVSNANRRVGMPGDPGVLRKLAEVGGGVAYFPESDDKVIRSFDELAGNIRRGYSIGYTPRNSKRDGSYRHLKVMVSAQGRNNLKVRTRDGYRSSDNAGAR